MLQGRGLLALGAGQHSKVFGVRHLKPQTLDPKP